MSSEMRKELEQLADECDGLEGLGSGVIAQRIRALLARTEAGAKCDHAWQPDSDVMNARYCPKCDVTQTIPKKTTRPQDASGEAEALQDLMTTVRAVAFSGDYGISDEAISALSDALDDAIQAKEAK